MEDIDENSKSKEKSNINSDLFQNQSNSNDKLSLSKKIYGENLNKNQYDKKLKEELSSFSENISEPIIFILDYVNKMINAFKKFQEFAKNLKASSTNENSEIDNNTAEEINDKDNKSTDKGKNKVKNLDMDALDDIYKKIEELVKEVDSNLENIQNKIEEIKDSKDSLSIPKENSTIISDFENPLSFTKDGLRDLKFQPKYNYFKVYDNVLEIRIEVPGNGKITANYKVDGAETIITFKGIKMKDEFPKKMVDNISNNREFGEFEINIPLKVQDFRIKFTNNGFPKFYNGIYIIQYTLAPKGETISVITEEL